jgi:hypothetical protein
MASKLKRVSEPAEAAITTIAVREDRTFVAQLDRVVAAGLEALGEQVPAELVAAATPGDNA